MLIMDNTEGKYVISCNIDICYGGSISINTLYSTKLNSINIII